MSLLPNGGSRSVVKVLHREMFGLKKLSEFLGFYTEFWQSSITFFRKFINSMFLLDFKKKRKAKQNRKVSEERDEWWSLYLLVIILHLLNEEKNVFIDIIFILFPHGPVLKEPRVTFLEIPKQE